MTSGWCQSHGRADQWHDVCEQRIADGFIESCDCPNHVDTTRNRPRETVELESSKTAPGRCANTVQPRGLADYEGVD